MPVTDSALPHENIDTLKSVPASSLFSLNRVFRESMLKKQSEASGLQLIVRCGSLPEINGNYEEISKLFDYLLDMIVQHPFVSSKLFLFVDCVEQDADVIDMSLADDFKRFTIRFHTTIATYENWKLVNSQLIIHCRQILSNYKGTLQINDTGTGCLFSISLPGKIQKNAL
jgi:hypothetical protein